MIETTPTSAPPAKPRRWQFSLRTLMGLFVLAAIVFWHWRFIEGPYQGSLRAIEAVESLGGTVKIEWQGPSWFQPYDQRGSFNRVVAIDLSEVDCTDAELAFLSFDLPSLRRLKLRGPGITDQSCNTLRSLEQLHELYLVNTSITKWLTEIGPFPNLLYGEIGDGSSTDFGENDWGELLLGNDCGNGLTAGISLGANYDAALTVRDGAELAVDGLVLGGKGNAWCSVSGGAFVRIGGRADTEEKPKSEVHWTIEGPGTRWWNESCDVANQGCATLNIRDGALFTSKGTLAIARGSHSHGRVTIAGPDTRAKLYGWVGVADHGNGVFIIQDGAQVESKNWVGVAMNQGGIGQATVRGAGSRWTIERFVQVGYRGEGTLTVEDGGVIEMASRLVLGEEATSEGLVIVRPGGTLKVQGLLDIGRKGPGKFILYAGGVAEVGRIEMVSRSQYQVHLAPDAPSILRAHSHAQLAGTLRWVLPPKTTPRPGESHTILMGKKVEGKFDRLEPPTGTSLDDWEVQQGPGSVVVTYRGKR